MSDTDADAELWNRIHAALNWQQSAMQQAADPVTLAAKLAVRAKSLRGQMTSPAEIETTTAFVAFRNGHERFGIPLHEVIEIQALDHYSAVPRVPSYIEGVIQWRGAILTLLNINKLFEIHHSGIADYHGFLVVEAARHRVAVVAGEIEEILSIPNSQIKPIPTAVGGRPAEWVLGVHDGNRVLLRMDQILQDERFH